MATPVRVLLEGRPGVGKTTVAGRLVARLREAGVPLAGFLTHEIRQQGRRVGFELETLDGRRDVLAHVKLAGDLRVGRYGVSLAVVERLAVPSLGAVPRGGVAVVDELGKMEVASGPLRDAVTALLDSPVPLVATVHVFRHPFTDALKRRPSVSVMAVSAANRDRLAEELAARVLESIALPRGRSR